MDQYYMERIYYDLGKNAEELIPQSWRKQFAVQPFSMVTMQAWDGLDFRMDFKGEGKKDILAAMEFEYGLLFISNNQDHIDLAESLGIAVLGVETEGPLQTPYLAQSLEDIDPDYLENIYRRCHDIP